MSSETVHLGSSGPPVSARIVPGAGSALEPALRAERERAHAAGRREALAELAEPVARMTAALEEVVASSEARLARSAADLAFAIARTLLRTEVEAGRYDVAAMVRATLADADVGRGTCTVHLHPDDHARVADLPVRAGTTLVADPEVPAGEVQVESALGLVVRSLEEGLENIAERVLGEVA